MLGSDSLQLPPFESLLTPPQSAQTKQISKINYLSLCSKTHRFIVIFTTTIILCAFYVFFSFSTFSSSVSPLCPRTPSVVGDSSAELRALLTNTKLHNQQLIQQINTLSQQNNNLVEISDNKIKLEQQQQQQQQQQPKPADDGSISSSHFHLVTSIAVGVSTFGARQNASVPAIRGTWGRHFEHIHYFSNTSAWSDSTYEIINVPHDTNKVRASWEEMNLYHTLYLKYPDSPWYYKADDDAWVNPYRLEQLAATLDPTQLYYVGALLATHQWGPHTYCAGGVGHLISNGLMKLIHPYLLEPIQSCCSDVQMGNLAGRFNVSCIHHPDFHGGTIEGHIPDDFQHIELEQIKQSHASIMHPIGFHNIRPNEQKWLEFMYHYLLPLDEQPPVEPLTLTNHDWVSLYKHQPNLPRPHAWWPDINKFPQQPNMRRGELAPQHDWNGHCGFHNYKCVISYSLCSTTDRQAIAGAVANAALAAHLYPGWTMRIYHQHQLDQDIMQQFKQLKVEWHLVNQTHNINNCLLWRLFVLADSSVDRYIIRDIQSRLSMRELDAVREWMQSGYSFHSMRDHPAHDRPINRGMWGGVKGVFPNIVQLMQSISHSDEESADQSFLGSVIWSHIEHDQLSHDAWSCFRWPNAKPFPTRRSIQPYIEHVGQIFDEQQIPREIDLQVFRTSVVDERCRVDKEWTLG